MYKKKYSFLLIILFFQCLLSTQPVVDDSSFLRASNGTKYLTISFIGSLGLVILGLLYKISKQNKQIDQQKDEITIKTDQITQKENEIKNLQKKHDNDRSKS
jgi:hypothetical protein